MTSVTVSSRNAAVRGLRSENSRLQGVVICLSSEVGSSKALCEEFELPRQKLADRDAEIGRHRVVLTLLQNFLDNGLAGPGN